MITVTFDGVEYTKASQVAKQFGYTSDYIGQLCRAKKINARLVGRSWFVNIPSLEAHREGRYAAVKGKVAKPSIKEVSGKKTEAVEIHVKEKKPSKKYLRRVSAPEPKLKRVVERNQVNTGSLQHVSVSYEADDNSLLPKMTTAKQVRSLHVEMAGSESVKVQSETKRTNRLSPEPLPDVALSGRLSISEIPDGEYTNEGLDSETKESFTGEEKKSDKRDKANNKDKKESKPEPTAPEVKQEEVEVDVTISSKEEKPAKVRIKAVKKDGIEKPALKPQMATKSVKKTVLKPRPVSSTSVQLPVTQEMVIQDINESSIPSPVSIHVPALGVVLGVAVGILILSAEQVGFVSSQITDFDIEFVWSNIRNLAAVLFTGR